MDDCYSRERYALCYIIAISPINGMNMWPEVDADVLHPPLYKKGPRKPKKIRFRELDKGSSQ